MTSTAEISSFYDQFQVRQLRDYVYGNLRVEKATELVSSVITDETKNVLDIGCGIGIGATAYAKRHSHIRVVGVDISPQNIETASRLSNDDRVSFLRSEMQSPPAGGPFDVITMIDLYEHIPVEKRASFHRAVAASLADNGVVVLTTPSRLHQQWLAEHKPEWLQIVDETVELIDIARLADDIGATVVHHEWVDIWRPNQYCYTILSRDPLYSAESTRPKGWEWFTPKTFKKIAQRLGDNATKFVSSLMRRKQVKEALGVVVYREDEAETKNRRAA